MLNFILKTTGLKKDAAPKPADAPKQQLRRSSRRKSSLVSLTETEPEETEPQVTSKVDAQSATMPATTDEKKDLGVRKSGRVWKAQKTPLRIRAVGLSKRDTAWDRKRREQLALKAFKDKARELKEEKEAERKRVIEARKAHKLAKEEKERYEMLAKKMHAKKVERLRKREKRNKLLKER